jgi:hypothetical protein
MARIDLVKRTTAAKELNVRTGIHIGDVNVVAAVGKRRCEDRELPLGSAFAEAPNAMENSHAVCGAPNDRQSPLPQSDILTVPRLGHNAAALSGIDRSSVGSRGDSITCGLFLSTQINGASHAQWY